ncbi:MAG: uracil-DNA glycosylase [Brumimicrobium sp.]
MDVNIENSWKDALNSEFEQQYFKELAKYIKQEYKHNTCYPPAKLIFSAFDYSPIDKTKVVIIGQDPYHGINQANGLCFSVNDGVAHPPSLSNIFKEIEKDLSIPVPNSGNLDRWAKQGVLLLNATLSVRAHQAGSHQKKGWEQFTDAVIKTISSQREGVVFLLWGGFAKNKSRLIDRSKHYILTSGHPSPLSANRGLWFGNGHFSKTNEILTKNDEEPIVW